MLPTVSKTRLFLTRSRAWLSLTLLAPIAISAIFTRPYLKFEGIAEFGIEFSAWLLFVGGACLRWWATLYIGGRKDQELITQGPYSICRNPLYLGTLLMTTSVAVFLQSVSLLAAIAVVSFAYLTLTVPVEEGRLRAFHGAAFDEYCRRVPRLFPNFGLYASPPELHVRLSGMKAEFGRMTHWATLPMICYLIEHLRMLPGWPTPITLP